MRINNKKVIDGMAKYIMAQCARKILNATLKSLDIMK